MASACVHVVGVARCEGRQGTGEAPQGVHRAQGERIRHLRSAVPPLRSRPAMGRVPHLLMLDLESGRITDLFEGTGYELPRATRAPRTSPSRRTADASPSSTMPQPVKRATNSFALAEVDVRTAMSRRPNCAWIISPSTVTRRRPSTEPGGCDWSASPRRSAPTPGAAPATEDSVRRSPASRAAYDDVLLRLVQTPSSPPAVRRPWPSRSIPA